MTKRKINKLCAFTPTELSIILCVLLIIWSGPALAQMQSEDYSLGFGGPVGGGGTSSSENYGVTGLVPLGVPGTAASDQFSAYAGPVAILYSGLTAFSAQYTGGSTVSVPFGAAYTLKVGYSGGGGDVAGIIHYRQGGATAWTDAAMSLDGDTLIFNVPAPQVSLRGLEFWFEVQRGSYYTLVGSDLFPCYLRALVTNAQGQRPTATPANQYRIVSLPIQATANGADDVFLDDLGAADKSRWRLGSFDPGTGTVDEYPDAADVTPGRGYWLITRNADTYGAAGVSVRPNLDMILDAYQIPLDSGWNLIATPYGFNVAWENVYFRIGGTYITDHPDTLVEDVIYSYTGTAYQEVPTLTPWNGVFMYFKKDGYYIVFPYQESSGTLKTAPEDAEPYFAEDFWSISLNLKSGEFADRGNFIGVRPDAVDGPDKYDFSEPPAAPESPWLALRLPNEERHLRRSDYRAPLKQGATWFLEMASGTDRVLSLGDVLQIPSDMDAMLVLDNGTTIDIHADMEIPLPDAIGSARVIIGVKEYTAQEISSILPREYSLGQNYPNPFNPITTIRFDLPAAGHVVLEVYNVLGQKVKTLVDEHRTAGFHTAEWNGTDNRGVAVASGVYFYRMEAGNFSSYRKMLLLK